MSDRMFLNIPVEGEVYVHHNSSIAQKSEAEVTALFAAVIGQRGVEGIAWTQYTPYFNDGSPCEFSTYEPYFAIEGAQHNEDRDYFDYGWQEDDYRENGRAWLSTYCSEFKRLVGESKVEYVGQWPNGQSKFTDFPVNHILYYPVMALSRAMGNGSCNAVLLSKFGDHAQVMIDVKNNKIIVEEYDHD